MYAITADIRKSRTEGMPGVIIFRIRDKERHERMISSGVQSTLQELSTVHRNMVLSGLRSLYGVIETLDKTGKPYGLDEIAEVFRNEVESGIAASDTSYFRVNKTLASVGKPFNEWIESARSDKERDFDGSKLTVTNLPGYVGRLLQSPEVNSRAGTLNNYRSTRNVLSEYINSLDAPSDDIDAGFVDDFHNWLCSQNISAATVSFYMSTLRAILNRAKEQGLIEMAENWFAGRIKSYNPDESGSKRKGLAKDDILRIADMEIESDTLTDLSRDLFMFSYYCRGMELIDILNLTPENLQGDLLVYNKRLAGKQQIVKIDPQARRIIEKYSQKSDGFIFSDITKYSKSREYNTLRRLVAPRLAEIGKTLGLKVPIVFSTARHSWLELSKESDLASMMLS